MLEGNAVIEGMMNVIFASPHHFYRRATHCLGKDCRFLGKVALRFASEAATEQRDVHSDIVWLQSEDLCDVTTGSAGALHARPDFGFAVLDLNDCRGRFHRNMDAV